LREDKNVYSLPEKYLKGKHSPFSGGDFAAAGPYGRVEEFKPLLPDSLWKAKRRKKSISYANARGGGLGASVIKINLQPNMSLAKK